MAMICPVCKAQNNPEAQSCQACNFQFSSPGGQNHTGWGITGLIAFDLINIPLIIILVISVLGIIFGYFRLDRFISEFIPTNPWVLAIREIDDNKTQLYALNWQDRNSLLLGESEAGWSPDLHLATSNPIIRELIRRDYSGGWDGGAAVLLPASDQVMVAIKQKERWQVNLADLHTQDVKTLVDESNAEPFISVAPEHSLIAVSVPATEETPASLNVFSLTNKLEMGRPLGDTISPKAIVSPNGEHLLYTVTMSKTDVTQVKIETQVITNTVMTTDTRTITDTQETVDTLSTSARQVMTDPRTITITQVIPGALITTNSKTVSQTQVISDVQIKSDNPIITDSQETIEVKVTSVSEIVTVTQTTTNTQHYYQSTLYLASLNGEVEKAIYKLDHGKRELPATYTYEFSPNSRTIVYETPQKDLYLTDIASQNTTPIYTNTESNISITWNIMPGSDYVLINRKNATEVELQAIPFEPSETLSIGGPFPALRLSSLIILNSKQILYSPAVNEEVIYNLAKPGGGNGQIPIPNQKMNSPLATKDLGILAFVRSNSTETVFNFYNVLGDGFAESLAFSFDGQVEALDFAHQYVVFKDKEDILYLKDFLDDHLVNYPPTNGARNISARFTDNPNYLLYTADVEEQTNIYRVDLPKNQLDKLLEDAQLLDLLQ